MRLVVGTRGSPLALWQTNHVAGLLRALHPGIDIETRTIHTEGDVDRDSPLGTLPRGLFAQALEAALASGEIDFAVHSFKDLAVEVDPSFAIAAITKREDPRDVLVAPGYDSLASLPAGSRLGTGSPRRTAQMKAHRPELTMVPVRGNVGTRIEKAQGPDLTGVIVAAAGVHRLALQSHVTEYLDPEIFLPEAGQGSIAVETRADDVRTREVVAVADDAKARAEVTAEVVAVRALGGGCTSPFATHARADNGRLRLRGMLATPDGARIVRAVASGSSSEPEEVARQLIARLYEAGAEEVLMAEQQ